MTAARTFRWCEHLVVAVVAFFVVLGMAEEQAQRRQR